MPAFFAAAEDAGRDVPKFVRREFNSYLQCGHFEHGFAKVQCNDCDYTYLIGFSCKGRGVCPSCMGRRMADLSTHLVDRVLPDLPYRQWVISFPPPLRYLLAYDNALLAKTLQYFISAVSHWQRHEAKRRYNLSSVDDVITGAVTVVQRFGSALNLNLHFHTLCPDGVWLRDGDALRFRKLGRPTEEELRDIGWRACRALIGHLKRIGRWTDEELDLDDDLLAERDPLLADIYAASIRGRLALGGDRGSRVMVLRRGPNLSAPQSLEQPRASPSGYSFDVHAGVAIEKGDRRGLERICRYLCRPTIADKRLEQRSDGRIAVQLKTPWRDGTSHVVLSPMQLVEKLSALIPSPRVNMIRYHGVFAPNSALRSAVVPQEAAPSEGCTEPVEDADPRCTHAGRQAYALLMRRIFEVDVKQCQRCGGETRIEFVTGKEKITRVLKSIGFARAPASEDAAA